MEEFFIKAGQLLLSLSILVVLHELGHFIPAKIFKTRVEKFYLFFDPYFSLFKKKIGDTEYGIGWLPLGGYVKISGMVDESMDKDQMNEPPKPYEFRSKPAWQRLIIMLGGVTVNVIVAFFIYSMLLFNQGETYIANEDLTYGVHADSVMLRNGFVDGDKILAVDGKKPEVLGDVTKMILIDGARNVDVLRNDEEITINLPENIGDQILESKSSALFAERFPTVVDSIMPNSNAGKSEMMNDDKILKVNDKDARYFHDFSRILAAHKDETVTLTVERNGNPVSFDVDVTENGTLGFFPLTHFKIFDLQKKTYTFAESIPAGINHGINTLTGYASSLKLLFSSAGVQQLGGFGSIGGMFGNSWDWTRFWSLTAFISIALAVMNILPIPALDGGHVMFLLYEIITGRPPGQKFMEYAQVAGMIILFTLLLYANGMDIFRAVTD